jgi:mRNA interferase MazF
MPRPGDVVIVEFAGAVEAKRRPAVVLSSDSYHAERPDVILGVLTTNISAATASSDYALRDWHAAGLHAPSAFRAYLGMALGTAVRVIGHLSAADWEQVHSRVHAAIA